MGRLKSVKKRSHQFPRASFATKFLAKPLLSDFNYVVYRGIWALIGLQKYLQSMFNVRILEYIS